MTESQLVGKFKGRDEVLAAFYEFHRRYPGARRKDPEEFIRVHKVKQVAAGIWRVHYTVPARYRHRKT